ncbi:SDR family NAD(P)-dependent oxidoreductase [Flammeovirga yaeyamensis]|uniref:SDR family NAD(P)-dependent oxidoreductase n=1 Tax=Flammeovirga yaeyamensis TaxID=367791 RepID=A0AAX1NC89_9BACT|nr:SDR family oxidoreductase [Flammeovirga yaeyamensis]MBB3697250.1 NAD(P)-dependent dehydrogenase (short-subunit alcohol dehydrogenase family) [Flammeovirga yaeyamensis]NMF33908.1 SDR family oxidoreductase [Flammeovirga yaeyamensis]QWG04832.1 SDR family NAD(P)-dependent oxidoreductase [Flammeovirga yaeyamensis]
MKRNVLITGTSTGVGLEASILFAKNGFKVYATMRNLKKADALKDAIEKEQLDIEILPLDVTDLSSIKKAVDTIIANDGKIDVLFNNAGAGFAKTTEQTSEEEIRWVTDVNYHGVVFCTKEVLPHMRKQNGGQIITITSVGGLVGQPFNEFYCGAKFAVEGYMEALANYVSKPFNIKITNVEPGGISTEFMASAVQKTSSNGQFAMGEYQGIFEKYMAGSQERAKSSEIPIYQTGKEVAEVVLQVAQNENPPLRIRSSEWAERFCQLKTQADPDGTKLRDMIANSFL